MAPTLPPLPGDNEQVREEDGFRFEIPLLESEDGDGDGDSDGDGYGACACAADPIVPQDMIDAFRDDGFAIFRDVVSSEAVDALNDRLEDVLRGVYDRGRKPDKIPRLVKGNKPQTLPDKNGEGKQDTSSASTTTKEMNGNNNTNTSTSTNTNTSTKKKHKKKRPGAGGMGPIGFSGNLENVRVLQIINIHKADSLFRKLETSADLASIVSQLAGWEEHGGARLAQDQFWAKPPHAPPLVFHRDSPYFMFEPSDVVTVWLALDDMDAELGPLEYVPGSHKWGDGRVGSASQFFQTDTKSLLRSAAEREGIVWEDLEFVSMAGLRRGGLSIHHGRIWHGSAKNSSRNRPRRGLGLHFVPASVRFTAEAAKSRLWKSYVEGVEDPSMVELCEEDFPLSTSRVCR